MSILRKIIIAMVLVLAAVTLEWGPFGFDRIALAQRGPHHGEYLDSRHHHDRYYPTRGRYYTVLPPGHRSYIHRGVHFYYHDGIWFRADGPRFVVVAPPIGLVIPVLPPFYATVWVGGVPYYYANDVYYVQAPGGYVVTTPPPEAVPPSAVAPSAPPPPPSPERTFIYPRQGQSQQQQAKDEYDCHRWAVSQTGFDPTQPSSGPNAAKRSEYERARGACLEARGYTVK